MKIESFDLMPDGKIDMTFIDESGNRVVLCSGYFVTLKFKNCGFTETKEHYERWKFEMNFEDWE